MLPAHNLQDMLTQEKYPHAHAWITDTMHRFSETTDKIYIQTIPHQYSMWAAGFEMDTAFLSFTKKHNKVFAAQHDLEKIEKILCSTNPSQADQEYLNACAGVLAHETAHMLSMPKNPFTYSTIGAGIGIAAALAYIGYNNHKDLYQYITKTLKDRNIKTINFPPMYIGLIELNIVLALIQLAVSAGKVVDMNIEEYNADSFALNQCTKDELIGLKNFLEFYKKEYYEETLVYKKAKEWNEYYLSLECPYSLTEELHFIFWEVVASIAQKTKAFLIDPMHPSIDSRIDRIDAKLQELEKQQAQPA